jgi:hypothetical protein
MGNPGRIRFRRRNPAERSAGGGDWPRQSCFGSPRTPPPRIAPRHRTRWYWRHRPLVIQSRQLRRVQGHANRAVAAPEGEPTEAPVEDRDSLQRGALLERQVGEAGAAVDDPLDGVVGLDDVVGPDGVDDVDQVQGHEGRKLDVFWRAQPAATEPQGTQEKIRPGIWGPIPHVLVSLYSNDPSRHGWPRWNTRSRSSAWLLCCSTCASHVSSIGRSQRWKSS